MPQVCKSLTGDASDAAQPREMASTANSQSGRRRPLSNGESVRMRAFAGRVTYYCEQQRFSANNNAPIWRSKSHAKCHHEIYPASLSTAGRQATSAQSGPHRRQRLIRPRAIRAAGLREIRTAAATFPTHGRRGGAHQIHGAEARRQIG